MKCPSCGRPDGDTHHGANKRLSVPKHLREILQKENNIEISEREHVCWLCREWYTLVKTIASTPKDEYFYRYSLFARQRLLTDRGVIP